VSELPATMKRLHKAPGFGNVELETVPLPEPGPREVLVRVHRSLISRGSEIGGRYRKEEATNPQGFGYSAAGEIVAVGWDVDAGLIGCRVAAISPHAEYVVGNLDDYGGGAVTLMPEDVSWDQAVFHPLATGAVLWTQIANPAPDEDVVIVGQGLVGNLILQVARTYRPNQLIAIDALPFRCELAAHCGATTVIDAASVDPVDAVKSSTGGLGAHLVMECVGGPAGVRSFEQSVRMTRPLGRVHLISLYHEQPLPLDSSAIQGRMLIGGYFTDLASSWRSGAEESMRLLADGTIETTPLVTHRFRPEDGKEAFDLLHSRPGEAFGVVFDWIS
jgi:threonine dehydrogenase-like Zn-dependent dehydrogenase